MPRTVSRKVMARRLPAGGVRGARPGPRRVGNLARPDAERPDRLVSAPPGRRSGRRDAGRRPRPRPGDPVDRPVDLRYLLAGGAALLVLLAALRLLPADGPWLALRLLAATAAVLLFPGAVALRVLGRPGLPAGVGTGAAVAWSLVLVLAGQAVALLLSGSLVTTGATIAVWCSCCSWSRRVATAWVAGGPGWTGGTPGGPARGTASRCSRRSRSALWSAPASGGRGCRCSVTRWSTSRAPASSPSCRPSTGSGVRAVR